MAERRLAGVLAPVRDVLGLLADLTTTVKTTVVGAINEVAATATAAVPKATYDANSILKADADNTPIVLAVAASRIIGRTAAGVIAALTPAETRTIAATTSAAEGNELLGSATVNGDRLVDGGVSLRKVAIIAAIPGDFGDASAPSAAQVVAGWLPIVPTMATTCTTPTAAAIVAAIPGAQVGTCFDVLVNVKAAFPVTLTPGAGVTLNGSGVVGSAIAGAQAQTFRARCDNVTGGAEAITIFRG